MSDANEGNGLKPRLWRFMAWGVSVYLVLVFGLAGWCGKNFLAWQNVLVVVVLPCAVALIWSVYYSWRNRVSPMILVVVMSVVSVVVWAVVAGMALLIAGAFADTLASHLQNPYGRAALAAGSVALLMLLMVLVNHRQRGPTGQSWPGEDGLPSETPPSRARKD